MEKILDELKKWAEIRNEQDGRTTRLDITDKVTALEKIEELKNSEVVDINEPNGLQEILSLCNLGYEKHFATDYDKRLKGALIGRLAGCILGVPVENFSIKEMQEIAEKCSMQYPPVEYWKTVKYPDGIQYGVNKRSDYTMIDFKGVPVDDDITYTVLNTLVMKKYSPSYTVEDIGEFWKDYLPYACTAEEVALANLNSGIKADMVAEKNPYVEWIGAAIRADAFGYVCPGDPLTAVKLCYNDAFLSHRRNGIYGEIFCAASIAAAFTASSALEAVKIGANYIPKNCRLKKAIDWALSYEGKLKDYAHARELIDKEFGKLDKVHTINNMVAVVFAIMLGENDFTKSISNSIAIGLDNDCNGATVGSIVGANVKIDGIDKYWYKNFDDTIYTYIKGYEKVSITDTLKDLSDLAKSLKQI